MKLGVARNEINEALGVAVYMRCGSTLTKVARAIASNNLFAGAA